MLFDQKKTPHAFWRDRSEWPRSPIFESEHPTTFLLSAFEGVGRSLFPDTYQGDEGWAFIVPVPPEDQRLTGAFEIETAHKMLSHYRPGYQIVAEEAAPSMSALGNQAGLASLNLGIAPFQVADWEFVRATWATSMAKREASIARRHAIAEWFIERIFDFRRLTVVAVDRLGGSVHPGPPEHWNARPVELDDRWTFGRYHPARPFPTREDPTDGGFSKRQFDLFVLTAQLQSLLGGEQEPRLPLVEQLGGGAHVEAPPATPVRQPRETQGKNVDAALRAAFGEDYKTKPRPDEWPRILNVLAAWQKRNDGRKFPDTDDGLRREVYRQWPERP